MAARTIHALSISALFLFFFAAFPAEAQQPYVDNHQLACEVRAFDNVTKGYTCNGPSSCRSYLTYWPQPPYNTAESIAGLLNASASEIQSINNLTTVTAIIRPRQLVIVPVNCSCSAAVGGFYQHNATYHLTGGRGEETYFSVANDTYKALSTCQALMSQNPYGEKNLTPGLDLLVPLRCACPTAKQSAAGFKYLLTYLVARGDSISVIADMFRSSSAAVTDANELNSTNIYFFTPLLVPLRTEPTKIETSPSSPPPPISTPPPQTQPVEPPGSSHKSVYIGIGIGAGLLLIITTVALFLYFYKRRSKSSPSSTEQIKLSDSSTKQSILPTTTTSQWSTDLSNPSQDFTLKSAIESLTLYRFHDLQSATSNFSEGNRIKGSVYRASINGDDAAVKVIKGDVSSSEINLLKKLNHSNIIRLSGFCIREGTSYLVYEYSENGSVSDWIHSSDKKGEALTWKLRVEIARDVAEALDYLHNYITPPHVHKNLESNNVLLDSNFRAKISNFGVARILDDGDLDLQLTRHVEGTQGYLAPEYVENGVITPKLDVFAFGVVVLELLSGKEAVTIQKKKEKEEVEMLCKVINDVVEGENVREKLKAFMDPSLEDEYPLELAYTMAQLAKSCVATDLNSRPSVAQVLTTLSMIVSSSIDWEPSHDLLHSGSIGN